MTSLTITFVIILFLFVGLLIKGAREDSSDLMGFSFIGLFILTFVLFFHLYNIRDAYAKTQLTKKLYGATYTTDEMYFNSREILNHEDYKFRYPKEEKK